MRKIVAILLCCVFTAFSQDLSELKSSLDFANVAKQKSMQVLEQPLIEKPVNADEYVLGPGDILNVIINSETEGAEQVMVSPEGFFIHPATGNFKVAGLTLSQARQQLGDIFKSKYITNDINIALVQLRTFRVTVSGAVYFPGLVPVYAMYRVSDAVIAAGGLVNIPSKYPEPEDTRKTQGAAKKVKLESDVSRQEWQEIREYTASKRNIFIKRFDESIINVDLLRYELTGDEDANPFLVDGDIIVVPTMAKEIGKLMISGGVRTPDTFEWAPGDNIATLLEMGHGFTLDADSSKIILTRFDGNTSKAFNEIISIDWENEQSVVTAMQTVLQPDDRIFVRKYPKYHVKRTVEIKGEVLYPGEYALTDSPTMLSELIEMAGGFTKEAALFNSYVARKSLEDVVDLQLEAIEYTSANELERRDKAYLEVMTRQIKGRLNANFVELFENGNDNYDFPLKNQDLIVIPSKTYTVNVVGQVQNPGMQKWQSDFSENDYIKLAGGYNAGAWKRQARVIKASSGQMVAFKDADVEMGDTIFIPPKIEKQGADWVRTLTSVATTVALITMYAFQIDYYNSRTN